MNAWRRSLWSTVVFAMTCVSGADAQTVSTGSLPSQQSPEVNALGPTGDVYAAWAADVSGSSVLEVVRISPTYQLRWSASLKIGQTPTPGGIAVDPNGNAYVSVNDMPNSAVTLVKLSPNGVFVSSATPPYSGAAFSPLIMDVGLDTTTSRLYTIMTVVDPNSSGQTRALAQEYDWNLNVLAGKILTDASWIADEANGLRVDAGKDIRVGVTEYASGSQVPSYEVATLNLGLSQVLGLATATQDLDAILLMHCAAAGPTSGPVNQTLSSPLSITLTDTVVGAPIVDAPVTFAYTSAPSGASGYSLSATAVNTDQNGTATTFATLGNLPGQYTVTTGRVFCLSSAGTIYSPVYNINATGGVNLSLALTPNSVSPSLIDGATLGITTLIVHATDSLGNALAGQSVGITAQPLESTGGHNGANHNETNRPLGYFIGGGCTSQSPCSAISCSTNSNGDCVLSSGGAPSYVASLFGGQEVLTAQTSGAVATSTLTVTVPNLFSFPASSSLYPSNQWALTGQTTLACGQGGIAQSMHPSNHWLTPAVQSALIDGLQNFLIEFPSKTPITFELNDMSLANGGLFDICGAWVRPHSCHRAGEAVDINTSNLPGGLHGQYVQQLALFMKAYGGLQIEEGASLHFQFPGNEIKRTGCQPLFMRRP